MAIVGGLIVCVCLFYPFLADQSISIWFKIAVVVGGLLLVFGNNDESDNSEIKKRIGEKTE